MIAEPVPVVNNLSGVAGYECPLCGGRGEIIGSKNGEALRECADGHDPVLLSWHWGTVEEYESLYSVPMKYHLELMKSAGQETSTERDSEYRVAAHYRYSLIAALTAQPSNEERPTVLDVGAGAGAFVDVAPLYGYEALGIEPDSYATSWARNNGRNVIQGTWADVAGQWDVITMHDVWEHLVSPMECLEKLRAAMCAGGLLVVELPEYLSPHHRSEGWAWRHIKPEQHIFLPSDGAAREMFRRAGLTVDAAIRPKLGALGKIAYYLRTDHCFNQ